MQAKVIALRFEPSDYQVVRSYSKKYPGRIKKSQAQRGYINMQRGGRGWDHYLKASKLTLVIQLENDSYEIWLGTFFRRYFSRLTEKVVNAIKKTQPSEIQIEPKKKCDGTLYYIALEDELDKWLERVKTILES